MRGDAAGDVEGLPIPGLALGLPLVDGEPDVLAPVVAEESVAPELVAPLVPDGLLPPPPEDALAPELLPLLEPPELEPLALPPRASAMPSASGPTASAIASSRENIAIVAFIDNLLRNCARNAHELRRHQRSNGYATRRLRCAIDAHRAAVRLPSRRGIMRRF
jgi:hypothetical protein